MQQSERDGLHRTAMDLRANLADAQGRYARLLPSVREMLLALVTNLLRRLGKLLGPMASLRVIFADDMWQYEHMLQVIDGAGKGFLRVRLAWSKSEAFVARSGVKQTELCPRTWQV